MEYLQIIRDIENKKYSPIYLLMGEEAYFIDLITDCIEEKVLDESARAFGQTVVYGRDVSMNQVTSLAKGFPMMGDRQVVIVKEAQEMKDWKKEEELVSLEAYLKHPTPSTILVFAMKNKTLDKRKKLYKSLDKTGVVFTSEKIRDYKMGEWIDAYVKAQGFRISHNASALLAEYLGNDLSKVVNEIGKLAINLEAGSEITPKIIEENIGISKDYNVWELQKALGSKDVLKANRIVNYFEANPKANPIQMVIPSLYGFFAKLSVYQDARDKKEAARELGLNYYSSTDYKVAATNFSVPKVERIIGYLRDADKKSKGINNYSVSHGELMKELVFKILH